MDRKDEFNKWIGAIEEALANENNSELDINILPAQSAECGCGDWQCDVCFPEQGEAVPQATTCPTCGHAMDDHNHDQDDLDGAVELFPDEIDGIVSVDEEDMDFDITPERQSLGQGVKLGNIIQKFVPADQSGEESPLTNGQENLGEEGWYDPSMDDVEFGGPLDRDNELISDEEMDEAMDMIGQIKYMQEIGLSRASRSFSENDMAVMNLSTLKKAYDEVMGKVSEEGAGEDLDTGFEPSQGTEITYSPGIADATPESIQQRDTTMENIDKDINTWLERFKAYDELRASKMPVMEKKVTEEDEEGNPWEKLASDKKEKDEVGKETKTHKGGTVTKTKTGLIHKKADESVEVSESADPEVLEWMTRFSKLGNMKGYGR